MIVGAALVVLATSGLCVMVGARQLALRLALAAVLVAFVLSLVGCDGSTLSPSSGVAFLYVALAVVCVVVVLNAALRFLHHQHKLHRWTKPATTSLKRRVERQ